MRVIPIDYDNPENDKLPLLSRKYFGPDYPVTQFTRGPERELVQALMDISAEISAEEQIVATVTVAPAKRFTDGKSPLFTGAEIFRLPMDLCITSPNIEISYFRDNKARSFDESMLEIARTWKDWQEGTSMTLRQFLQKELAQRVSKVLHYHQTAIVQNLFEIDDHKKEVKHFALLRATLGKE